MLSLSQLHRPAIISILGVSLFSLSGCGAQPVNVKGTLVPPANVQLQDTDQTSIAFQPAGPEGMGGAGVYNAADKSFVLKAADGKGITPGKYKVSVQITPYPGSADSEKREALFADLNDKYASGNKLSYEVTGDANQDVVIDLANGKVTKK